MGGDGRARREGGEWQKEESNWQMGRQVIYLEVLGTTMGPREHVSKVAVSRFWFYFLTTSIRNKHSLKWSPLHPLWMRNRGSVHVSY